MKSSQELKLAKQLVAEAGRLLKNGVKKYRAGQLKLTKIVSFKKTAGSEPEIVTIFDRQIESFIFKKLHHVYPGYNFVSEESYSHGLPNKKGSRFTWFLDPIDGTSNFVKYLSKQKPLATHKTFTISLALADKQRIILGVIFAPLTNELFWAEAGQGAFVLHSGRLQKLSVGQNSKVRNLRICLSPTSWTASQDLKKAFSGCRFSRVGSVAYRLAAVASGRYDATFSLRVRGHEWDTAAGDIIIKEAGGDLLTIEQQRLVYNKANPKNQTQVIAANRYLLKPLSKKIRPFLK